MGAQSTKLTGPSVPFEMWGDINQIEGYQEEAIPDKVARRPSMAEVGAANGYRSTHQVAPCEYMRR